MIFLCLEALALKTNVKVSNNKTKPRDFETRDFKLNREITIIENSY